MAIKKLKPVTPGQRFRTVSDFAELTASTPEKSLLEPLKKSGGRNNRGRVTAFQRGGGHKRRYRVIDFKRDKLNIPARVSTIEYDPNRSGRIALLVYADGEKRYILWPNGLKVGDTVVAGDDVAFNVGNALPLGKIPLGTLVHNVELQLGRGGQMARSAGSYAQVMAKDGDYVTLRLPSGEVRLVHRRCFATIGEMGNCHARERHHRQGRQVALARPTPARARRGDESLRPPARRWRGTHLGRAASLHPVGQADQGLQDAQEAAVRRLHRAAAEREVAADCRVRSRP